MKRAFGLVAALVVLALALRGDDGDRAVAQSNREDEVGPDA